MSIENDISITSTYSWSFLWRLVAVYGRVRLIIGAFKIGGSGSIDWVMLGFFWSGILRARARMGSNTIRNSRLSLFSSLSITLSSLCCCGLCGIFLLLLALGLPLVNFPLQQHLGRHPKGLVGLAKGLVERLMVADGTRLLELVIA